VPVRWQSAADIGAAERQGVEDIIFRDGFNFL